MKGKAKAPASKSSKATTAKKNAEAQKTAKKEKSPISQSKNTKKK
jgi:hypothetical protein